MVDILVVFYFLLAFIDAGLLVTRGKEVDKSGFPWDGIWFLVGWTCYLAPIGLVVLFRHLQGFQLLPSTAWPGALVLLSSCILGFGLTFLVRRFLLSPPAGNRV